MRRRLILLLAVLAVLLAVTALSAAAEDRLFSYSIPGYSGSEQAAFGPLEDDSALGRSLTLTASNWTVSSISDRARFSSDPFPSLWIPVYSHSAPGISLGDRTAVLTFDFSADEADLTLYQTMSFGLYIADNGAENPVDVVLYTDRSSSRTSFTVTGGSWNLSLMDISRVSGRLVSMIVTVTLPDGARTSSVRMIRPNLHTPLDVAFESVRRFGVLSFSTAAGAATSTGKVKPDESGRAVLTGELCDSLCPDPSKEIYLEIRTEGLDSGSLRVGVSPDPVSGASFEFLPSVSLTGGVTTVALTGRGAVRSYSLEFEKAECDVYFQLVSVRFLAGIPVPSAVTSGIGSLRSVTREGTSLHFSGTLERESFSLYRNAEIGFFAVPAGEEDPDVAVELGRTRLSTRFEFTVDITPLPVSAVTFRFFAALITDEGERIPFSSPRYIDAEALAASDVSLTGLYDAASVGVFESNVSNVIVDVPLDRLLSDTGTALSYNVYTAGETVSRLISLDQSILSDLDRDIAFYDSAGIRVYLRLTENDGTVPGGLDGGPEEDSRYAAIIRFLARRYTSAAGCILGTPVNGSGAPSVTDPAGIGLYADRLATLLRITYNAASASLSSPLVLLPLTNADPDEGPAAVTLSVMVASRIAPSGQMPWGILWHTDRPDAAVTEDVTSLTRTLSQQNLAGPSALMLFIAPSFQQLAEEFAADPRDAAYFYDYAAARIGSFWDSLNPRLIRAAFLSLTDLSLKNNHNFYRELKSAVGSAGSVFDSVSSGAAPTDSVVVWDFTDAYYSLGWVPGGGVSSCVTDVSGLAENGSYSRALCVSFEEPEEPEDGIAGIILRNLNETVDLTPVTGVTFTFALTECDEEDRQASVVFLVGTDETRAEYTADRLTTGMIYSLTCDLSEYEGRRTTDYVGMMVYAERPVRLKLVSVSFSGDGLTREKLDSILSPEKPENDPDEGGLKRLVLPAVLVLGLLLSGSAVAMLVKRDRDIRKTEKPAGRPAAGERSSR